VPVQVPNWFDSILFKNVFICFISFDLILNISIRIYLLIHISDWARRADTAPYVAK
jgi:hypothetical protein